MNVAYILKLFDKAIYKWGLIIFVALCFIGLIKLWDANRMESEYKRGYEAAYAEVQANNKTQSDALAATLAGVFDKHTQTIIESLQKDKVQREKIEQLLKTGVYVNGNCHEPDALRLLNDKIRERKQQN